MITRELQATLGVAVNESIKRRHEYITLEHLLFALLMDATASNVLRHCGGDLETLRRDLTSFLSDQLEKLPEGVEVMPEQTTTFRHVLEYAMLQAEGSGQREVNGGNILAALYQAEQSHAVFFLKKQGITRLDVLNYIAHGISKITTEGTESAGDRGELGGEEEEGAQAVRDPL